MKHQKIRIVSKLSNIGYIGGCVILFLIALAIIVSSVYSIYQDLFSGSFTVYNLLDEVGLIVFSIAVIDVSKYLMIEEVLRPGEAREPCEVREALTKFAVIIATALSLEGLVLTIEMAKSDVTKILYPVMVLLTGVIFIVGIGIYQKFNASAEQDME